MLLIPKSKKMPSFLEIAYHLDRNCNFNKLRNTHGSENTNLYLHGKY